jgi:predicted metal-dependent enzyme (double-stranded beta helix superfamily)
MTAADYISRVERIVSSGAPSETTVASIQEALTASLESPGWLPERCRQPEPGCYARHLLHQDPQGRFSIVAMVWGRGQSTPIHDHGGVWCVEGVYEGKIRVNRYDLDAPMKEGCARFHSFDIVEAGIGSTGSLIPPVDYHTIGNPFDQLAITVHTYGGVMKTCHVYLPRPDGSFESHIKELTYTSSPGAHAGETVRH